MCVKDTDGAISLVKDWIEQRGISGGIKIEPTPEDVYFQFTGKDVTGIPFLIVQPKTWKKTLLIVSEGSVKSSSALPSLCGLSKFVCWFI